MGGQCESVGGRRARMGVLAGTSLCKTNAGGKTQVNPENYPEIESSSRRVFVWLKFSQHSNSAAVFLCTETKLYVHAHTH